MSFRIGAFVALLASLAGCRTPSRSEGAPAKSTTLSSSTAVPEPVQDAAPSSTATSTAGGAPAPPKLKPIQKTPLLLGAEEPVICEAIDSKEADLWVRFGHIVPLYVPGALYVLEATIDDLKRLESFIENDYTYPRMVQQAACSTGGVLMFLRGMPDHNEVNGYTFGRKHLSTELEKRFGIKTRESFQLEDERERLAEYCRADAEICDALVKLDEANGGKGLCSNVGTRLNLEESDVGYADFLSKCKRTDSSRLACSQYALRGSESLACEQQLRAILLK